MKIAGGGGVALHVVEAGDPKGQPLLFIHGYCQSTHVWRAQFESDLARDFRLIAFDLRGHGDSAKPAESEAYTDSRLWADDVAAIFAQLGLDRTVAVAWSYAGLVISDYLRCYGTQSLGALNLVGAVTVKGGEKARPFTGPEFGALFPAVFSDDAAIVAPILERFADLCAARPWGAATRAALIRESARVPAVAREAMQRGRLLDNDDILSKLDLPVLVTHGTDDAIVLPASAEHNARIIPNARLSLYPGVGHSPFAEEPERFNRELRELAYSLH